MNNDNQLEKDSCQSLLNDYDWIPLKFTGAIQIGLRSPSSQNSLKNLPEFEAIGQVYFQTLS